MVVKCVHFHRAAWRLHIVLRAQELVRKGCLLLTLLMVERPSTGIPALCYAASHKADGALQLCLLLSAVPGNGSSDHN